MEHEEQEGCIPVWNPIIIRRPRLIETTTHRAPVNVSRNGFNMLPREMFLTSTNPDRQDGRVQETPLTLTSLISPSIAADYSGTGRRSGRTFGRSGEINRSAVTGNISAGSAWHWRPNSCAG